MNIVMWLTTRDALECDFDSPVSSEQMALHLEMHCANGTTCLLQVLCKVGE